MVASPPENNSYPAPEGGTEVSTANMVIHELNQSLGSIDKSLGFVVDTYGDPNIADVMEASSIDAPNHDQYVFSSSVIYPAPVLYDEYDGKSYYV